MNMKLLRLVFAAAAVVGLSACAGDDLVTQPKRDHSALALATFAGGCFWCVEADFERVPGVVEATSGYTGGHTKNPTYRQVTRGTTGHRESVEVRYDPQIVTYDGLLEAFWRIVDPTDAGGQFADRGEEYTTAIFFHTEAQRVAAERSKAALQASGRYAKSVVTPIVPARRFYIAEDYHQDYYRKNPLRYSFYRFGSGRDRYLEKTWGEDLDVDYSRFSDAARYPKPAVRKRLTPMQYEVT